MKTILMTIIRGYRRWVSPALPGSCRFAPTCSAYALLALERHGTLRGSILTTRRFLKCHPFHPGGYDPVPERPRETGKRRNGETEIPNAV